MGLLNLKMSDEETMSMLFTLINASIKCTLTKSWAGISLRFQWRKFGLGDFIDLDWFQCQLVVIIANDEN